MVDRKDLSVCTGICAGHTYGGVDGSNSGEMGSRPHTVIEEPVYRRSGGIIVAAAAKLLHVS